MKAFKLLTYTLLFIFLNSCQSDHSTHTDSQRSFDPWIFRSVLDQKPRIITLALDENLWAAYSTKNCALYQAWKGVVNFEGAVYDTQHGPQPLSVGEKYLINKYEKPWALILSTGDTVTLKAQYRGHKVVDDKAVLMYELSSEKIDNPILIEETVEALTDNNNQALFSRNYNVSQMEGGHQLIMSTNFHSIAVKANVVTDGKLNYIREQDVQLDKVTVLDLDGELLLNSNGSTNLEITFMVNPAIHNPNFAEEESKDTEGIPIGLTYIAKSDCKTCHNKSVQTIGPSYVSIAEKYPNSESNISLLASKIKNGGTGIWGSQVMTPHPDLSETKINAMVEYILSLAENEVDQEVSSVRTFSPMSIEEKGIVPGLITKVYNQLPDFQNFKEIDMSGNITQAGILPDLANIRNSDFRELDNNFAMSFQGFLKIEEEGLYTFRIWSDDGSQLYINDELFLDNDGMHGTEYKEGSANLTQGFYPLRVEYFQGGGEKFLSLNWKPVGAEEFITMSITNFYHKADDRESIITYTLPMAIKGNIPGDACPLNDIHPSFDLFQARPLTFTPKVGGMDFFSDGRLAVSTWDPEGAVYVLGNLKAEDPEDITITKVASGLAEPLGLKIVNDEIYIMQKQELTHLIDTNGDEVIDEYRTICDGWTVSSNFHEFGFGLEYKDGFFYASLATAIDPGGASTQPQMPDRGKVIKISKEDGSYNFIASGLRTPNGIGWGYGDELFVCDNQGDWLPSSKLVHVTEGAWFGSRSVDQEGTKDLEEKMPVVWLPQDEIGNSPSTPSSIDVGPYKGQMIHGEVTHGGIKRVFVEEVEGKLQGALFRFTQGLEAGVNRLTWSPDGDLYVGGIGNPGNWGQTGKLKYGLQRLSYNGKPAFEMLAIRAKTNGLEIEFTEPLSENEGWQKSDYEIKQWYYLPTKEYGGPKMDLKDLNIKSVHVSDNRKKVFLELEGMESNHVIYIHLLTPFISKENNDLWSTEAWYTMNVIPRNNPGFTSEPPPPREHNSLTAEESASGWQLLFDGQTTNGWRNFRKESIGSSWKVVDGVLYLDSQKKDDGGWQAADGGDIITDKAFENYEFSLEWKISNCGNSGIIFNVVESDEYEYVWHTGPEMQILDNTCHPDTRFPTHRAGDLYDMIESKFVTVNPAGDWNKVRILSDNGKVQFWLNGYKIVNFEMHTDKWRELIANSKFKDMPAFGSSKSGHIALQDHGDPVFFRNIKIKEL